MQYDQVLDGDEDVYCFVYDYEPGMFGTHKDALAVVNGDEVELQYTCIINAYIS